MSTASPPEPSARPPGPDADPALLGRIERTALAVVLLSAAVGWIAGGAAWGGGVIGGGVLAGTSYWAIRSSVDALVLSAGGGGRQPLWWVVARLAGRHALLAAVAYVIIARLRLHPVGLLIGASAIVVAAVREAFRAIR
jgi:hypothetical protein